MPTWVLIMYLLAGSPAGALPTFDGGTVMSEWSSRSACINDAKVLANYEAENGQFALLVCDEGIEG